MGLNKLSFRFVDKMVAYQHGGSLRVTIPAPIAESLGLAPGDPVAFFKEESFGIALIINARKAKIDLGFEKIPLAFSISKDTAEQLRPHQKRT